MFTPGGRIDAILVKSRLPAFESSVLDGERGWAWDGLLPRNRHQRNASLDPDRAADYSFGLYLFTIDLGPYSSFTGL
ncbi:hypothetical protein NL676_035241 [Syzygium grande]|nr:hypothetical protein NL676_035241 [Syzygium grande]